MASEHNDTSCVRQRLMSTEAASVCSLYRSNGRRELKNDSYASDPTLSTATCGHHVRIRRIF